MPITGIWSDNLSAINFKILSFRGIASIVFILLEFVEFSMGVHYTSMINCNLSSFANVVFLGEVLCGLVLLFCLAKKWNRFIRFWAARENCYLNSPPYKETGMRLKFKINLIAVTFFVMAAIEHAMSLISSLYFDYKQYTLCRIHKISFSQYFFYKERAHIFTVIPYHWTIGLIITVTGVLATFCWNFVDILIIVISVALTKRFEQLNVRIVESCEKLQTSDMFWIEVREHYVKLIQIKERIDYEMAYLILLSCACNLFSLCLQLFNSFNNLPFLVNKIYFWSSLSYLILRTFSVFYSASLIYEVSRKPIRVLNHYPAKYWNSNVQRFMDMIKHETVVLSANQFFYLTKSMILGMAGTIITYELVLMQEVKQDPEKQSFCNITRLNISSFL